MHPFFYSVILLSAVAYITAPITTAAFRYAQTLNNCCYTAAVGFLLDYFVIVVCPFLYFQRRRFLNFVHYLPVGYWIEVYLYGSFTVRVIYYHRAAIVDLTLSHFWKYTQYTSVQVYRRPHRVILEEHPVIYL